MLESSDTRAAAHDAKARIARTDALTDFTSAIAKLDEIKRLHRDKTWVVLPDRYSALKKSLILVRTADPGISDEQKSKLQSAVQHLSNFENQVEKALATNGDALDVPKMNRILSSQVEVLTQVFAEIRNEMQG